MTNKEFYSEKLLAVALENACATFHRVVHGKNCGTKSCENCEFSSVESIENWLNTEHVEPEPPLLENGDGLKPGDWIMVRDHDGDSWDKMMFACYCNGLFFVVDDNTLRVPGFRENGVNITGWRQARLPEEGE